MHVCVSDAPIPIPVSDQYRCYFGGIGLVSGIVL